MKPKLKADCFCRDYFSCFCFKYYIGFIYERKKEKI